MVRSDVLYLITESPEAHGVFDAASETKKMVYCVVRSVGMSEVYQAKSHGLDPQYVFELADYTEYRGEKIVEYNGVRYEVFRTYTKSQKIEITVVRSERDV